MFRLHIDVPLTKDQTQSEELANKILEFIKSMNIEGVELAQYRLSNDTDRGNKNYFDINENGHCSNKKLRIVYGQTEQG